MSRQTMQESLSAVMDNQADELELRRVLAASEDPEVRATWARFQLARAAMHRELVEPRLDLVSAVSAAIADEPVPKMASTQKSARLRNVGRWAVAASVTVAVLAGVRLYNQNDIAGAVMAQQTVAPMTLSQTNNLAMLAAFSSSDDSGAPAISGANEEHAKWHEQRLPIYLRQHARQAAGANDGALPFARSASLEGR
ncbi:sigma-E factor negative regulatory protein [Pseudomonas sp. TTU2014-080ASC]|uniref:sigma-E factor negative regulatory protein n=1 Tax=Pseudomonas sp. TTU2014-080ASC TaxID=1729724 RepID=UPI00071898F5|nr:RseA family anti-sigma factor [Pseudomonas sp. TTU2014-080ASC]KRW59439.1 RNA polymerase subunit sigma [Pseudomonas sp. TTU2014-080ASC]